MRDANQPFPAQGRFPRRACACGHSANLHRRSAKKQARGWRQTCAVVGCACQTYAATTPPQEELTMRLGDNPNDPRIRPEDVAAADADIEKAWRAEHYAGMALLSRLLADMPANPHHDHAFGAEAVA